MIKKILEDNCVLAGTGGSLKDPGADMWKVVVC